MALRYMLKYVDNSGQFLRLPPWLLSIYFEVRNCGVGGGENNKKEKTSFEVFLCMILLNTNAKKKSPIVVGY